MSHFRTAKGELLTTIILEVFRLNGTLLEAGDVLTREFGLSSSRWQVLGALRAGAKTVPGIAREMGLSRQNVQRIANRLTADGFIHFMDNPNHKRSRLAALLPRGRAALDQITRKQNTWVNKLASSFDAKTMETVRGLLQETRFRLEADKEKLP